MQTVEIVEKPVIFLDIDGVLNSTQFFHQEAIYPRSDKRSQLDRKAISFLNEIADWRFVLSSTWRKFYKREQMNNLLQEMGFKGYISDYTPILDGKGLVRGNEILVWMRENNLSSSKNYVIFDDDSDLLYWQRNNFIHVDNYFGLGPNHVWRAKQAVGV
jgi:hypothetical protein